MNEPEETRIDERLTRIETQWTLVMQAHDESGGGAVDARQDLLKRYSGAVYRYLLGAVRDPDAAEELSHDFAVRLLEGKFFRASPDKGKFRSYLKTVLINLVNDYFKSRGESPRQLNPDAPEPAASAESLPESGSFEQCLHDDLLNQTWIALRQANANYYAALLSRVENPDSSATEIAALLSSKLGRDIKGDWVRKTIERARAKFANLLVDRVNETFECSTSEELHDQLKELGLLSYCRSVVEQRTEN